VPLPEVAECPASMDADQPKSILQLRELNRRADPARVGQGCTTLDPIDDLTAIIAQPAGEFCE
jgi:hypothetical protein